MQRLAQGLAKSGHEAVVQWFGHHYELMPWRLKAFEPPPGTDVVHANSWQGFAFRRAGIPLVVTEHQYVAHPAFAAYQGRLQRIYHRHFIERCMRRSYAVADSVVAVSEFCAAAMRRDMSRPVEMIHNWINTSLFAPADSPRFHAARDPVRLLFAGNPSLWKGADMLPALAEMLGGNFQIHCIGGLRNSFKNRAVPCNMVFIPRATPEGMVDVYRSVDMVLALTRYEAFGYVALEAMACGLPVVGFNSAGTSEICIHGETALLSPVDDLRILTGNISRLANESELMRRMGLAGRRRAVEHFDEPAAVDRYIRLYRKSMGRDYEEQ